MINEVTVPGGPDWFVSGDRLQLLGAGTEPFAIPLDPDMLANQLCRISDRELTLDEMSLLPTGESHERPARTYADTAPDRQDHDF